MCEMNFADIWEYSETHLLANTGKQDDYSKIYISKINEGIQDAISSGHEAE